MKEMVNTEKIVGYLKKTYQPDAVIVYGSFADGSANLNSDFDALIIAGKEKTHDSSIVDGVVLEGHSAVNESALTGESIPADKAPGGGVYAGLGRENRTG